MLLHIRGNVLARIGGVRCAAIVLVAVLAVSCTDASETTSTSVPVSTTSTVDTSTTSAPACRADPIPAGAVDLLSVPVDGDGDGVEDRLLAYVHADVGRLRVETGSGSEVEVEIDERPGPAPFDPIGGHDLDLDGRDELFVAVGTGAYTFHVGIWTLDDCRLDRLTVDGIPAAFPFGASSSNVAGLSCPETGGIETVTASYVSESRFEGAYQRYELADGALVAGESVSAVFEGDEVFAIPLFDCGRLSYP